jgi:hypothetical protein
MSKKQLIAKNISLSEKLADFMAKNPKAMKKSKRSISYVMFSANDQVLNKANEKVMNQLLQDGEKIIKAEQINDTKNAWILTPVVL